MAILDTKYFSDPTKPGEHMSAELRSDGGVEFWISDHDNDRRVDYGAGLTLDAYQVNQLREFLS